MAVGDINNIIVIESLKNERRTGLELYSDCIIRNLEFRKSCIISKFYESPSKKSFIELLKYYQVNAKYIEGGILIHLEMHGENNLKGLILSDGSLIEWLELVELFRPINIDTCNNLYVSIASCYGRYLYLAVDPYKKSPYSCYISANSDVSPNEIVEQYFLLFENLIEQKNLINAYLTMEANGTSFYYKDSKTTFEEGFKVTARRVFEDPDLKAEIIKEAEEQIKKEGLQMPPAGAYEMLSELALKNIYNRQKKAFEFDCEQH